MDFASGLANLEQAAANSQSNNRGQRRDRDNDRGGEDHRRYQPRPRYNNDNRRDNYRSNNNYRSNDRRELDGLTRYGYRLPRSSYQRPPAISADSDRPLHIGLLAITIDDLPYEHLWKAWASQSSSNKQRPIYVSLLCHAKFPDRVQSEWLKQRMLLQPRRIGRGNSLSEPEYLSHKPAWGSVEITRGMIDLLVQGMLVGRSSGSGDGMESDARFATNRFLVSGSAEELSKREDIPPVDKFVFISETCLPVTTLEECVEALFPTTKREHIEPNKPRWEPPPAPAPTAARWEPPPGKEHLVKKKEDEEEEQGDKKEEEAKKEEDAKPISDNPINQTPIPDEFVVHLDTSWVNARNFNSPNTPSNKYERDQFNNIHRVVPKRYRWKADQWMVLSRAHAAAILDIDHSSQISPKDQLWNSFRRINASDEMYFPTTLSLAGILVDNTHNHNPRPSPWLERRAVTYTDWSMGMRNPQSFTKGLKDFATVARLARNKKTLFARKFCPFLEIPGQDAKTMERTGDISVEEWQKELEVIMEQEKEAGGKKEEEETGGDDGDKKEEADGEEGQNEEEDGNKIEEADGGGEEQEKKPEESSEAAAS